MPGLTEKEWETRKQRIDVRLRALNPPWQIVAYQLGMDVSKLDRHAVTEYPTQNGPADYALFIKGKFLGIIEAKKVGTGPGNVLEQAKRYSRGALDGAGRWGEYHVPLLYATNGEAIHFIDVRTPEAYSRELKNFHTATRGGVWVPARGDLCEVLNWGAGCSRCITPPPLTPPARGGGFWGQPAARGGDSKGGHTRGEGIAEGRLHLSKLSVIPPREPEKTLCASIISTSW